MHITLFLALQDDIKCTEWPALKKLIKKGKKLSDQPLTGAGLLGITNPEEISQAAIDAAGWDLMGANTSWLHADPVTIITDHKTAFLVDRVNLTEEETMLLLLDLNEFFYKDDYILFAPEAHTWLLNIPLLPALKTIPVIEMLGVDIAEKLPQGEDQARWHTLFTEIQMLLHNHPVNQKRREQQLATVDALWFWGEGALPQHTSTIWTAVYSDDRSIKGLCDLTSVSFEWLPDSFSDMADTFYPDSENLIILSHDLEMQQIEQEWLQPIIEALKNRAIESLTLILPKQAYRITPKLLNRWWW